MTYVRSAQPNWSYVDLNGLQLDDTYYLFTLYNTLPYLPAPIYQTPQGTSWSDPIQFLANGTLPDNLYWDPDVVYRLEIRHGDSQSDTLVYEINNYVPTSGGGDITSSASTTDNQISNPQFAEINFSGTLGPIAGNSVDISIAPGWRLVGTGSGSPTYTVSQNALSSSTQDETNAPYSLTILSLIHI